MTTQLFDMSEPIVPTAAECDLAVEASRRLAPCLFAKESVQVQLMKDGCAGETIDVPAAAARLLARILTEMANGNALKVVAIQTELFTEQAADLISVPHDYFVKLLDRGEIPFCTVGKRRRVRFKDLMAYKKQNDHKRLQILDELAAQAQELNMGY